MWTRSDLKTKAKGTLKGGYWLAFAAVLIVSAISSFFSGLATAGINVNNLTTAITSGNEYLIERALSDISAASSRASLISFIAGIFILNPLTVGLVKYFIKSAAGENSLGNIWDGFKTNYKNVIFTLFKRNLFVGLWSLLFIVPGIIKAYQYAMVEYILADDPTTSSHDALIKSREMMKGNKWNFFVLQLSFIGWILLGAIACGIGTIFVEPYIQATYTQFYLTLKGQQTASANPLEV